MKMSQVTIILKDITPRHLNNASKLLQQNCETVGTKKKNSLIITIMRNSRSSTMANSCMGKGSVPTDVGCKMKYKTSQ